MNRFVIVIAIILAIPVGVLVYRSVPTPGIDDPEPWKSTAITADYASAQLKQLDANNAALVLTYELRNNTDLDYQLTQGNTVIMSRTKSGGSLSSQQEIELPNATFVPARERARASLTIPCAFRWPADNDPAMDSKLKSLVNQTLDPVAGFVLFEAGSRIQIEFPAGWEQLRVAVK